MSPEGAALLQLAADLKHEIEAIDRVAEEAAQCVADLSARPPTRLELRGAGDIVHDFYNGVERYLERVANEMNGGLPSGLNSHAVLLERMSRDLPSVRPFVLRPEVARELDEYLRFRHVFRHRYGFEIQWEKLSPLLQNMADVHRDLRRDLVTFADTVAELAKGLG
jgi:uncharacterized protein YutE (UPF0331/DUF86 family)